MTNWLTPRWHRPTETQNTVTAVFVIEGGVRELFCTSKMQARKHCSLLRILLFPNKASLWLDILVFLLHKIWQALPNPCHKRTQKHFRVWGSLKKGVLDTVRRKQTRRNCCNLPTLRITLISNQTGHTPTQFLLALAATFQTPQHPTPQLFCSDVDTNQRSCSFFSTSQSCIELAASLVTGFPTTLLGVGYNKVITIWEDASSKIQILPYSCRTLQTLAQNSFNVKECAVNQEANRMGLSINLTFLTSRSNKENMPHEK